MNFKYKVIYIYNEFYNNLDFSNSQTNILISFAISL